MVKPLIRIGVMSYNHAQYLPDLFDSIIRQNQEIADYEVVLTDDASTDCTKQILHEYREILTQSGINNSLLEYPDNAGVWENLSALLMILKHYHEQRPADFIQLIDGDDYFKPSKFYKQIKFFEEHPNYAACHTDIDTLHDDGSVEEFFWRRYRSGQPGSDGKNLIPTGNIRKQLLQCNFIYTCTNLIRSEALFKYYDCEKFRKLGLFFGDYAFFLQMSKEERIGYLDENLSIYRNRSNSMSHKAEDRPKIIASTHLMIEYAKKGIL